jgi:hypothetical protein
MPEKETAVPVGTKQRVLYCPKNSIQIKAREPVRRTCGRVVGRYPSTKNSRMISWESQLEQKACGLFEFSPGVLSYREQPETIRFQHQGAFRRYTPDFCIEAFGGRKTYIEVKPEKRLSDPIFISRLRDINTALKEHNIGFALMTERELVNPILQSNLRLLRQSLQTQMTIHLVRTATEYLVKHSEVDIRQLSEVMGSLNIVYSLIAQRYVKADLMQPITLKSIISVMEEEDYESFLFTCRYAPDFI